MNWQNLKQNKCPKCDGDFGFQAYSEPNFINCPKKGCSFKISHKRFSEIVSSQVTASLEKEWEQEYKDDLL